jgi:hypothetical protein
MSPFPISLFAILSVAACAPVASNEPPPGGKPRMTGGQLPPEAQIRVGPGLGDHSCSAENAQRYVGHKADRSVAAAAMKASGAKLVRVIEPDMMVTMEFRGDRLNIRVDDAGKIIAIDCG